MQGKFHLNRGHAPHLPHIPHSGAQWVEFAIIVAAIALFAFLIVERTVEMAGTASVVGSEARNASASAYTIQRQETLKDVWLARGASSPSIAYSVDRQEALKDAWLARGR